MIPQHQRNLLHQHQTLSLVQLTKQQRKQQIAANRRKNLSTTAVALYLLRFNVSLQIAVLAIIVNFALAIATFYNGLNALYCAFGMDCIIGVLTSAILIWRFASSKHDHLDTDQNVYLLHETRTIQTTRPSHRPNVQITCPQPNLVDILDSSIEHDPIDHARELWSTFWLGQVMIIAGLGIVIRTVVEIISHVMATAQDDLMKFDQLDYGFDLAVPQITIMEPLYTLAFISLMLNIVLMIFKIIVYIFLGSNSMLIEGINSFISSIFAFVTMISIRNTDSIQCLDQIVSIMFGIFLIIYGGYNMIHTIGETVYQMVKTNSNRAEYQQLV